MAASSRKGAKDAKDAKGKKDAEGAGDAKGAEDAEVTKDAEVAEDAKDAEGAKDTKGAEDNERSAVEVGNRIREERDRLGLSQEDLAQQIFVSRQTVSNWETGKTYPDVQSLLLLSNLFEVSVDSLVKGDVEAMQEKMENYELDRFKVKAATGLSLALIVVGAVMLGILSKQGQTPASPFFAIAILLLVAGVAVSYVAQRIENRYDIDTMREVKAFLDGAEPDQIERNRKMPKAARDMLRMLAGAVAAVVFMGIVYLIIGVATHI